MRCKAGEFLTPLEVDERRAEWYMEFLYEHGYAPTVREFGEYCGASSTSTALHTLKRLISRDLIPGRRTK